MYVHTVSISIMYAIRDMDCLETNWSHRISDQELNLPSERTSPYSQAARRQQANLLAYQAYQAYQLKWHDLVLKSLILVSQCPAELHGG